MPEARGFVFFDLPPEIRNIIYGYLLHHKSSTKVFDRKDLSYAGCLNMHPNEELLNPLNEKADPRQNYDLHPTILQVSHQVHDEAARVLYGENYFTWTSDQFTALRRRPNERSESRSDGDLGRVNHIVRQIENPAILLEYTNRLDTDIPPRYLRLITRLHLRFALGILAKMQWRLQFSAMEMTVNQIVQALRYNNLKHVLIEHRITLNDGAWYYYDNDLEASSIEQYAKMLIQFGELRGLRTVSIRALSGSRTTPWIIEVMEAMKTPRSEQEEAVRLEGWFEMGPRIVSANGNNSEKKQGEVKEEIDGDRNPEKPMVQ